MLSVRPFTSSKSGLKGIFGDPFDEPKKKKKPVVRSPGVFQRLLSGLGSGLEIIDRPRRSVQEGVAELLGVGDKKVGAADILLHGKTGTTGRELVDKAFGELNPKKTPWYNPGNLARAAGGFGLDVLLDPLTYAGVGLVGKTSLAGKAAIKELAEEVGEKAARKIVMETIEKGGRELGEKAGIRAFGKTVIPMSKIAKGSEFLGLSRAGRGIKNSGIGQAIGKRLMPGFMPKEIAENLPAEYADLWGEAHDFIKAMGRQKELRTSRVVEAVRRRAAPFSDDELRTALRVIENPRLGKGLRESGQLSDELVDYIRQVKKESKGAAFVEQKAGLLGGGLRKNYVKHLLSEAIPGGRKMASALPREYTGTVADVNAAAGRDLFEQILSVAHGTRMAESTRKLTNADMVDQFMKRFGAEIKPGTTIPAGWKVYKREGGRLAEIPRSIITEPHGFGSPSVVRRLGKETETVEKIKEVLPQILGLEDASPELLGLEKVGRGDLAGLPWMNKEVQSKVKQVVKTMTNEEAEKFTKELASYRLLPEQFADLAKGFVEKDKLDDLSGLWRKGHALWKSQVYGLRPGAQGRNFLWNNIVSGIAGMRNPGRLAQAVDVVSGRPGTLKTKLGEEIPYEQIKKWAQEFGVEGHGFYGADVPEKVLNMLGRGKKSAALNPLDLNNPIYRGARKFGTGVENNARYGLFIDQLAKGETPEQAARIVNKHLFDYSDLTQFDQQAKQAIPFYCVPVDHEILTMQGFKRHEDLTIGEQVMGYNHETGELAWTQLEDVAVFPYQGTLKSFERKGSKFLFTDDHRWPIETIKTFTKGKWYGGKRSIIRAHELNTGHQIPLTGDYRETESLLSPRHAAILGWVVSDGYHRFRGKHCEMLVYQSPKKHLKEIVSLLGTRPRGPHPTSGVVAVPVAIEDVRVIREVFSGKCDLPRIAAGLSRAAAEAMWDAMFKAEGWTVPTTGQQGFAQDPVKNREALEAFQILTLLIGRTANLNGRGAYVRNSKFFKVAEGMGEEFYNGPIWCPKTKYGTWVMRHDGAMMITGNTFTKKNMALQPKLALEHPGIYAALPKGKEAVESLSPEPNEEFLPDYLKRNASIRTPFQQGKNPLYWLANLGFEDLKKPLSPNDLFSMLSPAIKIPTELMTNKNIYFDSPIEKTPGRPVGAPEFTADLPAPLKKLLGVSKGSEGYYEGKDVMSAKTRYLLEQIPLERDLTRILANTETSPLSLLAFLTGARLTPYDEKLAEQFGTGKFPRKKKAEPFKIGGKVFSGKGIF